MGTINKTHSKLNEGNVLRAAYNDTDATISVNGFLVSKVGAKVVQTITTTTIANDTTVMSFYDNGTLLYALTIIFTDGSRNTLISAERTA